MSSCLTYRTRSLFLKLRPTQRWCFCYPESSSGGSPPWRCSATPHPPASPSHAPLPKSPSKKDSRSADARPRSPPRHLPLLRIRISGAVFALGHRLHRPAARDRRLRPRRQVPPAERARRGDRPPSAAGARRASALGVVRASKTACCAARLKPLPALFSEEERSKQPSVFSILRALIEEFRDAEDCAARAGRRVRLRSAVPVRSDRAEAAARRRHKDLHLFLCDDIYFMDRKKEQIERYQYDFDARRASPRVGLPRDGASASRRPPKREPAPDRLATTRPKSTWRTSKRSARACSRGDYYEVVLRQTFRAPYSGKAVRAVRAHPEGQPQPLRIPAAVRRRAAGRRVARDVRARRRHARRNLPDLRHRAAHGRSAARRRQHSRAAQFDQGRVRADNVHRRGPQRQVARLRAGIGEGDRPPADRIATPACSTPSTTSKASRSRASIRSTRSSPTCGR